MVCLAVAVLGFTVSLCFSQGGNPRGLSLAHRSHFLSSLRPPPESGHESAPTLSDDARALLCTCIERLARTGVAAARLAPGPAAEVRALLSHSQALTAPVWSELFGALPPRGTVARLARRLGARLHDQSKPWRWSNKAEVRKEVRKMARWYRPGRKKVRRRKLVP